MNVTHHCLTYFEPEEVIEALRAAGHALPTDGDQFEIATGPEGLGVKWVETHSVDRSVAASFRPVLPSPIVAKTEEKPPT